MSQLYESMAIVNSWHAINADTQDVIPCTNKGVITPEAGTTIVFETPKKDSSSTVEISTLVFTNGSSPTKLIINDNEKYPFYLDPKETRGLDYIYVYKIKVVETGGFYYEGMCSRM